jgi:hypothetical protein
MRCLDKKVIIIILVLLLIVGCSKKHETKKNENDEYSIYQNKKYGFSFSYPVSWEEVKNDEPNRWAILDKQRNVILVVVNNATSSDLLKLGKAQAIKDYYPRKIDEKKINDIVKLRYFNSKKWYTYAIKFSDKNIDSIVSGTLCNGKEINLVLVTNNMDYDKNKEIYIAILNSFKC